MAGHGRDHGYRAARQPARHPEERVPCRQQRVPVLVDGDEVISDSKRILEYLEWKYTERETRSRR